MKGPVLQTTPYNTVSEFFSFQPVAYSDFDNVNKSQIKIKKLIHESLTWQCCHIILDCFKSFSTLGNPGFHGRQEFCCPG